MSKKSWRDTNPDDDAPRDDGLESVPDFGAEDSADDGKGTAKPEDFASVDGVDGGSVHDDDAWDGDLADGGEPTDIADTVEIDGDHWNAERDATPHDDASIVIDDDVDDDARTVPIDAEDDGPDSDYNPVSDFVAAGEFDDDDFEGQLPGDIQVAKPGIPAQPSKPVGEGSEFAEEFDPSVLATGGTVFGDQFAALVGDSDVKLEGDSDVQLDDGGSDVHGSDVHGSGTATEGSDVLASSDDEATVGSDVLVKAGDGVETEGSDVLRKAGDDEESGTRHFGGTEPLEGSATIVEDIVDPTVLMDADGEFGTDDAARTDYELGEDRDQTGTQKEDIRGTFLDDSNVSRTIDPSRLPEKDREVWRKLVERQEAEGVDSVSTAEPDDESTDRRLIIQQRRVRNSGDSGVELADYEVINSFAEGGMGKIYLARQQSVNRAVALKMLKPEFENDVRQREGFLSEAVVTSDLDHPNIVPVHDLARTEDHQLFYAMKLVGGTPWHQVVREKSRGENLEILMKVADGVAFAHSRGVVHRDLKPENIMLGDFGEVLVMDWGLAVVTPDFEKPESIRRTNSRGGSPAYMAPEMVTGPVRRIGTSADVYLLGAILYEIVTGHPPHSGSNVSECIRAAAGNKIVPAKEKGELVDIALKAMATLPDERYGSVRELQDAIRAYQSHSESIVLSDRATEELETARESKRYEDFARSVFAYEEAHSLWAGNSAAVEGARVARYEYAEAALAKEDYDLGLSTLDSDEETHRPLLAKLEQGRKASRARSQRIKTQQRIGAGLVAMLFVGGLVALYFINGARTEALAQKVIADDAAKAAKISEGKATAALALANDNALSSWFNENVAALNAEEAKANAELAEESAVAARASEANATKSALEAQQQRAEAEQEGLNATFSAYEAALQQEAAQASALNAELAAVQAGFAADAEAEAKSAAQDAAFLAVVEGIRAEVAAEEAKANAKKAQDQTIIAQEATANEKKASAAQKYEAYIAQVQLANERIEDGSYQVAADILDRLVPANEDDPDFRGWEWYRLAHVTRLHVWAKEAPPGVAFEAVSFTPDGKSFAVAGSDGKVRVWQADGAGGAPVVLDHGRTVVRVLGFVPGTGGDRLVTGADDGQLRFWQRNGGEFEVDATVEAHTSAVTALAFAPDSDRLATGSRNGDVRLFENGEPRATLRRHRGIVRDLAFLGTAEKLVSAGEDGRAVVWDVESRDGTLTGKVAAQFLGHDAKPILSVAYSTESGRVATGGLDGRILLWNPEDPGQIDIEARIQASLGTRESAPADEWKFVSVESAGGNAHGGGVRSLRFSRDGNRLVSGSTDRALKVWDLLADEGERPTLQKTLLGHGDAIAAIAILDDAAESVLSVDTGGTAKFWDVARYQEQGILRDRVIEGHTGPVTSAGFDPRTGRILSASVDRSVRQWSPADGTELVAYRDGHDVLVSAAQFVSIDGQPRYAATAAAFVGELRLWDLVTGAELAQVRGSGRNAALAVSADGEWIATGGDENRVLLWRVADLLADRVAAQPARRLDGHDAHVSALAFSPNGDRLYSGDDDGVVLGWTTETGARERVGAHWGRVNAIVVLPAGDLLTASSDKTVERWRRTADGLERIETPLPHPGAVVALAGSKDGKTFLSVARRESETGTFELAQWNADGTQLRRFPVRAELVSGVALDPSNADRAVTVEGGNALRVWTLSTGQSEPRGVRASSAAFSPAGDRILTTAGATATLWAFDAGNLSRRKRFEPHGTVNDAAWSADGKFVASVGSEGALKIWPAAAVDGSDAPAAAFTLTSGQPVDGVEGGTMHTGSVNSVVFVPGRNDYFLLTGGADRTVKLWKWTPGENAAIELVRTFEGHTAAVNDVALSADGKLLVAAGDDGSAIVWSTFEPTDMPVVLGDASGEPLNAAAFCPVPGADDEVYVATGGSDDTVRIWTLATKTAVVLTGHGDDVTSVAWSHDGRRLLSGSLDGTAKVWDTPVSRTVEAGRDRGRELLTLQPSTRERSPIASVAFSPFVEGEPQTVLTAAADGSLVLFSAGAPE